MLTLDELETLGFDRSEQDAEDDGITVRCSQCVAACINGTPCHETGCPNGRRAARVLAANENDGGDDNA